MSHLTPWVSHDFSPTAPLVHMNEMLQAVFSMVTPNARRDLGWAGARGSLLPPPPLLVWVSNPAIRRYECLLYSMYPSMVDPFRVATPIRPVCLIARKP